VPVLRRSGGVPPGAGKVKVCEHCNTVVLRGAANLEAVGKVAELTETGSPLRLHLSGRYSGNPFTVAGRIQKQNAAGTWDEWCLAFDDGRTGWLSESEGEWNFMTPLEGVELPDVARLEPLSSFALRERRFVVEEKNRATTLAAEGQLPDFHASTSTSTPPAQGHLLLARLRRRRHRGLRRQQGHPRPARLHEGRAHPAHPEGDPHRRPLHPVQRQCWT